MRNSIIFVFMNLSGETYVTCFQIDIKTLISSSFDARHSQRLLASKSTLQTPTSHVFTLKSGINPAAHVAVHPTLAQIFA
jgi:hypothetical protein